MKNMAKQMELFEPVERGFEEGGLMDEGGTVDPISGNDVPPGSMQEEVRDDIPAQLSEGEFVFPADVVRYFGLEKLMQMRQQAKMGLKLMEEMGQMGNSEEATMPDDLPFSLEDLDMEEEGEYNDSMEMAKGGVVYAANGTFTMPSSGTSYTPPTGPTTGYTRVNQPSMPNAPQVGAATPAASSVSKTMPGTAFIPQTSVTQQTPTFGDFIGKNIPNVDFEYVEYTNEAGDTIRLRKSLSDGTMLDPIPDGYKLKTEEVQKATTDTTRVDTSLVRDGGGNDSDPVTNELPDVTGIGYDKTKGTKDLNAALSKYGAGFGTLIDSFVKGPANAMMQMPGLMKMAGAKPTALANAATSAGLGGMLDNIRGLEGGILGYDLNRLGGPSRDYTNNMGLHELSEKEQNALAGVIETVMPNIRSNFVDAKGNAIGSVEALNNVRGRLSELGLSKRDIDKIAGRGGNFNVLEKLTRALGNVEMADYASKSVKDAEVIGDFYARQTRGSRDALEAGNVSRDAGIIGRELTGGYDRKSGTATGDVADAFAAADAAYAADDSASDNNNDNNNDGGGGFTDSSGVGVSDEGMETGGGWGGD